MQYIYIPNGAKVDVPDGKVLPASLFKPVKAAPKAAPRKRASKPKE